MRTGFIVLNKNAPPPTSEKYSEYATGWSKPLRCDYGINYKSVTIVISSWISPSPLSLASLVRYSDGRRGWGRRSGTPVNTSARIYNSLSGDNRFGIVSVISWTTARNKWNRARWCRTPRETVTWWTNRDRTRSSRPKASRWKCRTRPARTVSKSPDIHCRCPLSRWSRNHRNNRANTWLCRRYIITPPPDHCTGIWRHIIHKILEIIYIFFFFYEFIFKNICTNKYNNKNACRIRMFTLY